MATENHVSATELGDAPIDEYSAAKPLIRNLLIVSLSTFPSQEELKKSTFCYTYDEAKMEVRDYFYQQEPFPLRLQKELSDHGEVVMLVTPEVLKVEKKRCNGTEQITSPQAFFMNAVRHIPGLEQIVFKSVIVDQNDPIGAVSDVVNHLREIKRNNKALAKTQTASDWTLEIYLGTNGGLRGTQLILEAILSLLSADGLTVRPDHVWSMRSLGREWEMFSSAAEFKIFDFVSGINEFLNYGRLDSLRGFLKENPKLNDDSVKELMICLEMISEGIQLCSLKNFEAGLSKLRTYFANGKRSHNPYIEMFRGNIRDSFCNLLGESRTALDEIEWCYHHGFYQQAYTLTESALPREYMKKGMIRFDKSTEHTAQQHNSFNNDLKTFIFNSVLLPAIKKSRGRDKKGQNVTLRFSWEKRRAFADVSEICFASSSALVDPFRRLLHKHIEVKNDRNALVHSHESGRKMPREYKNSLKQYISFARSFYDSWEKSGKTAIIMIMTHGRDSD